MDTIKYSCIQNWSIRNILGNSIKYRDGVELCQIGDLIKRKFDKLTIEKELQYKRITIRSNYGGIELRDIKWGKDIKTKHQYKVSSGQLLVSKIDARRGAVGIVPKELSGAIITSNFWAYDFVDKRKVFPEYLSLAISTSAFMSFIDNNSNGSTGRHYMQEGLFMHQMIPLPSMAEQKSLVRAYNQAVKKCVKMKRKEELLRNEMHFKLLDYLEIEKKVEYKEKVLLQTIGFREMSGWSVKTMRSERELKSSKFDKIYVGEHEDLFPLLTRGKSPKYSNEGDAKILNQKCIRNYDLDISYMRGVDSKWLKMVSKEFFTKKGDVLINSTGEGTLGRSTVVSKKDSIGLMYDSHVLLLRLNKRQVNPDFFCFFFNSQLGQEQIERLKTGVATSQTELGIENLKKMWIFLPSIDVQKKIVRDLNRIRRSIVYNSFSDSLIRVAKDVFEKSIIAG